MKFLECYHKLKSFNLKLSNILSITFKYREILRQLSSVSRFLINMLIVNILSSTLYLPLVLLSLFFVTSDDGLVTSDAGLVQGLLFNFISQFIGALSVLSTLCTGLTILSPHNIVSKV